MTKLLHPSTRSGRRTATVQGFVRAPTAIVLAFSVFFILILGLNSASCAAGPSWPQWLGPARNGHAGDDALKLSALPKKPQTVWRIPVGNGYSAPVVAGNRVVYFDAQSDMETVHVLDASTGKELWSHPVGQVGDSRFVVGPRATPMIEDDRVYVQTCKGEFRCYDIATGAVVWGVSFEKDFGLEWVGNVEIPTIAARRHGHIGSGVIEGERLVLPVGSTNGASLVCFNKRTGKEMWRSHNEETSYASLVLATFAGVRQVVALNSEALLGAELATGKVLWRSPLKTQAKRHAATPVLVEGGVVVNSVSLGVVCFGISRENGNWKVAERWANRSLKINVATPVLMDGYLYSHGPSKDFVCVDVSTGNDTWSQPGFGADYSSTLAVGKNLLVLTDDGQLVLVAGDPTRYHELGRFQACGKNWNFPAYAGSRLYVRDARELACYEMGE